MKKLLLLPFLCALFSGCALAQTTPFNSISVATSLKLPSGAVVVASGGATVAPGEWDFGGNVSSGGNFVAAGNINATSGSINAGGALTAGTNVTASSGTGTFNDVVSPNAHFASGVLTVTSASGAVFGSLATFSSTVYYPEPLVTFGGTAPSGAVGSAAGSGASITINPHSGDGGGFLQIGLGSGTSVGQLCRITYNIPQSPLNNAGTFVTITDGGSTAPGGGNGNNFYVLGGFVVGNSTYFDIDCTVAPAAHGTITLYYHVMSAP